MNHCFTFVVYNVVYCHVLPLIEGIYKERKGRRGSVRSNILNSLTVYLTFLMQFCPRKNRTLSLQEIQ